MEKHRYLIAADTGGTFTDLVVYDRIGNTTRFGKTLTTYGDLVDGVLDGVSGTGASLADAELIKHGTTQVVNAFIQRQGDRVALVTTSGFRDVLEIARGSRPVPFDLTFRRDAPLVPRDRCLEVDERIDSDGAVLRPLDLDGVRAVARAIRAMEVDAVAVSFLNAYRNPVHEQEAAAILRDMLPGVFVTAGTALTSEWGEYERATTAAANAYVGKRMEAYIDGFIERLDANGFAGSLYMMGSNGGAISVPHALRQPIVLLESGPVGGCIGTAAYARALGFDKVIAFDMGGTTAKCALIENGHFDIHTTYYVGGYEYGFPVRTPVLDIVEVGAGGGSIGWIDAGGSIRLGPRSAGSTPGPICFGRGGEEPTLTDANVVLGRIGADSFLDGKLKLDVEAAREGIRRHLSDPLGLGDVDRVAAGLLDIAVVTMTGAIKEVTIERGRDVRDFALVVFGGGGPLFASLLAREMGISTVIVPPHPGAFSSLGMLLADARFDVSRTHVCPLEAEALEELPRLLRELEGEVLGNISGDLDPGSVRFEHDVEMRYAGQKHAVRTRLPERLNVEEIRQAFEEGYRFRYARDHANAPVEVVMLRVSAVLPMAKPDLPGLVGGTVGSKAANEPQYRIRDVYFSDAQARIPTRIYDRRDLPAGFVMKGPAIVEEYSSTTVLGPGDVLTVGALGELRIDCSQDEVI